MGGLYIPGRSSVPKEDEYRPSEISRSRCSRTKSVAESFNVCDEKSNVVGSSGLIVAKGQAPSLKDRQTESASGWFGCCSNRDSKRLTLMGVTILNRSGRDLMVLTAKVLFILEVGIDANGSTVSVDVAEGVLEGAP